MRPFANLLLIGEIAPIAVPPDFGEAFVRHLAAKTHPEAHAASLTAWTLLARGLYTLGFESLPQACFERGGTPFFKDVPLHFSLSHSERLACALISPEACALDVEHIHPESADRLRVRCLNPQELALGLDFFTCWTKKECIVKLDGRGLPARPSEIDSLDPRYKGRFFSQKIFDSEARAYMLAALCMNGETPEIQRLAPEALR